MNVVYVHAGNLLRDKYGSPNGGRCQYILNQIADYMNEAKLYESVDIINLELFGDPNITFDVPKSVIRYNGLDAGQ